MIQDGESNFDEKIKLLLRDAIMKDAFYNFCKSTLCSENLDFWYDVEDYKRIPSTETADLAYRCALLNSKYIASGSPQEINLPSALTKELVATLDTPDPNQFNTAQEHIFGIIKNDSYPKFRLSDNFTEAKQRKKTLMGTTSKPKKEDQKSLRRNALARLAELEKSKKGSIPLDSEAEDRVSKCKRTGSFHLSLDKLSLNDVPKESTALYLNYLDLSRNNLTFIDNQLLLNNLNSLQALYLDFNSLLALPAEIVFLKKLKVLSLNFNQLSELPANLGQMESLKYLGIKGNAGIRCLPFSIYLLNKLEELVFDSQDHYSCPETPNIDVAIKTKSLSSLDRKMHCSLLYDYFTFLNKFGVSLSSKSHWIKDRDCHSCCSCSDSFTNLTRRHHCRMCGLIFCNKCSSRKEEIPLLYKKVKRVCDICFEILGSVRRRSTRFSRLFEVS